MPPPDIGVVTHDVHREYEGRSACLMRRLIAGRLERLPADARFLAADHAAVAGRIL